MRSHTERNSQTTDVSTVGGRAARATLRIPRRSEEPVRPVAAPEPLTYTVTEVARALGISRSTAYECVHRGEIPTIRFGRRVVVARTTLEKLLSASGSNGH